MRAWDCRERSIAITSGQGLQDYEQAHEEATADHIFGVPIFVFNGEPFWGHDRIPLLEHRLYEAGLARETTRRPTPEQVAGA